ncbi:CASTOR/POLLUX-related putative ion channel [Gayadomonas joobiniege]|uniref:CASTOR/POLLUX-related putative ion channel n=1 Tax=Gayadomonas joobiniege TaxID=1234606 RepID=UPI000373231B|nr:hypothetical protein [Gayadomonas joobiniege]
MYLKSTVLQPIDRLKYFVERQLVKGAGYQLFVIVACIALVSLFGGLLLSPVSSLSGHTLSEDVWWAFLRLTDPGYLGDDQGAWPRTVSTILTLCGYVLFMGTLVAIMTRWLIAFMEKLEQGLTPVSVKQHIVILGMSSRTVPVIRELLGVEVNRSLYKKQNNDKDLGIVLLAEEVNAVVHQQLLAELSLAHKYARRIVLRSGKALQAEALHRVACLNASAVILSNQYQRSDSTVTTDVETIKALLTINVLAKSAQQFPRLVVELDDGRHSQLALKSYQGQLNVLATDQTVSRLVAQCVVMPGLLKVYSHILTAYQNGQFFFKAVEAQRGKTLAEARKFFSKAMLIGFIDAHDKQFYLAIGEQAKHKLEAEDMLVFIGNQVQQLVPDNQPYKQLNLPKVKQTKLEAQSRKPKKRLLILGWNRRIPNIIKELDLYRHESFEITLVSTLASQKRQQDIDKLSRLSSRIQLNLVEGDYMVETEMRDFDPHHQDIIMLVYSDRMDSADEADARVLVGAMALNEILKEHVKRPHVLIELSDPSNESFLEQASSDTFITPLLMSHLLSQVALVPESQILFETLMNAEGAQIKVKPVADYSDKDLLKVVDAKPLVEAHEQILIGVIQESEGNAKVCLNLDNEMRISALAKDLLVVIG